RDRSRRGARDRENTRRRRPRCCRPPARTPAARAPRRARALRAPPTRWRTPRNSERVHPARASYMERGARFRAGSRLGLPEVARCGGGATGSHNRTHLHEIYATLTFSLMTTPHRPVAATRETPDTFRLLVEGVRDYAIFMLDGAGRVLTWNAGAERLKGYRAEDIIGKHFSCFYPDDAVEAGKPARMLALAARDGRVEDEGWRVRQDGSRFWADVVITALRDPDGSVIGFAKVTRDTTERRRAELALHESEERFRLLVESVKEYAIFVLDPAGRVASWNAGAEAIKGYAAEEILGQHFSVFYTPEDVARGTPQAHLDAAERDGRLENEGWRVRKDGNRFWADAVITAIRDPAGTLIGFGKVTRDLSARRRTEEQLAQSHAELERFSYSVSHDLRAPLRAINGYAQAVLEDYATALDAEGQRFLGIIRDSA